MNVHFLNELRDLNRGYEKLKREQRKLEIDHIKDVEYYLDISVFDSEWEESLLKTSSILASTELRLKIILSKMFQIHKMIFDEAETK